MKRLSGRPASRYDLPDPICEVCSEKKYCRGTIIGDNYYKAVCNGCYALLTEDMGVSSGQADYNRGRDAEEHEADMIQPWVNGKPSGEFINLYPERSKTLFTDDEFDQATRS